MKKRLLLASGALFLLALVAIVASRVAAQSPLAVPTITGWSSTGGHPTNKDDDQDIMYLVEENDTLTFHVTVDQPVAYEWEVNKITQTVSADTFVWTVPDEKGIWEIHLRVHNGDGEDHVEWVVSTLSLGEAPTFFDHFTDLKSHGRTERDPWDRALPEWQYSAPPPASQGFAENWTYSFVESPVAYGTWRFKYRYPAGNTGAWGFQFSFIRPSWTATCAEYSKDSDSHHHCTLSHDGEDFSIDYDAAGIPEDGEWHTVTIIRTRDGWMYMYQDDMFDLYAHDNAFTECAWMWLRLQEHDGDKVYFDSLEIYQDRYLFPEKEITYGEYIWNYYCESYYFYPQTRQGIIVRGRGVTLQDIAEAINDPSLFTYDPASKTAVCYTDLVVYEGAELVIENETLKFHSDFDGERHFVPKYASRVAISNSTVTSDDEHYFVWNNAGSTTHNPHELSLRHPDRPGKLYNMMTLELSNYASFIIENSVISNTTHIFFDSPYEVHLTGTEFVNLREVDIGNYTFQGSHCTSDRAAREFAKGDKAFWMYTDDLNIHDFTLQGLTFSGNQTPISPTFMLNTHRDRLNIYDVNVDNGNIVVKKSLPQTSGQSHTCYHEGLPYEWMNYVDSMLGLVNCQFDDLIIATDQAGAMPKYYLDLAVVDANGHPVPGAVVTLTNEVDNVNYPPENMESTRPYATGEYSCYYHHYRFEAGQPLTSTATCLDGHTAPPSESENTVILTDYAMLNKDHPEGIGITWRLYSYKWSLTFDVYDDVHGRIHHQWTSLPYDLLGEADTHHMQVTYDAPRNTIRLTITDGISQTVWDSGEQEIAVQIDPYRFDRIGFKSRHVQGTPDIHWDGGGYVHVSTDAYRGEIEAHVDNMQLDVDGVGLIEDNDYTTDPGLTLVITDAHEYYSLAPSTTDGKPFTWEFDTTFVTLDPDGPWMGVWLESSEDTQTTEPYTITYTYGISATKEGCMGVTAGLDPNPSWYRDDPESPTHTVTVTLPCDLPPAVMGYTPTGARVPLTPTLAITFTEPVSRTAAEGAIAVSGGVSPTGFAWSDGDRAVTFTLTPTLAHLTTYTATVGPGVADLAGHLSSEPFSWQFTTQGKCDLYLPLVLK